MVKHQDGDIIFDPPLPKAKIDAFKSFKMLNGTKIIACFKQRLWPVNCSLIFCPNSEFSQVRPAMLTINT